jgi:hypothetical protein
MKFELNNRIIGIETELTVVLNEDSEIEIPESDPAYADPENIFAFIELPQFIRNGGRIYWDNSLLEVCTPENRSPIKVARYNEVMHRLAWDELLKDCRISGYSYEVYRTNTDNHVLSLDEAHFAATHENYEVDISKFPEEKWKLLTPFFIARVLIDGAGIHSNDGNFYISQQAPTVKVFSSALKPKERGIIKETDQSLPLNSNPNRQRFQVSCGDSKVSPFATMLTTGVTSLILNLAENNKFIFRDYDINFLHEDFCGVSREGINYRFSGFGGKNITALEILKKYYELCNALYYGQSKDYDEVLDAWSNVLNSLELNRDDDLIGKLDWKTKEYIIDAFMNDPDTSNGLSALQSVSLEYHRIDPGQDLFDALAIDGKVLFPGRKSYRQWNRSIEISKNTPPSDTRAYGRGNIVKLGEEFNEKMEPKDPLIKESSWHRLVLEFGGEQLEVSLPSPEKTYSWEVNKVQRFFKKFVF